MSELDSMLLLHLIKTILILVIN